MKVVCGKEEYRAPELDDEQVVKYHEYDVSTDVYAFGVVLAVLVSGWPSAENFEKPDTFIAKRFSDNGFEFSKCVDKKKFKETKDRLNAQTLLVVIKSALSENLDVRPNMNAIENYLSKTPDVVEWDDTWIRKKKKIGEGGYGDITQIVSSRW